MVDIKVLSSMIGEIFGNWFVIKFVEVDHEKFQYWFLSECDCGHVKKVRRVDLMRAKKRADLGLNTYCFECRVKSPNCGFAVQPSQTEERLKDIEWLKSLCSNKEKL